MRFKQFIIESTVAQLLKSQDKQEIDHIKNAVDSSMSGRSWYDNLSSDHKTMLRNWLVFRVRNNKQEQSYVTAINTRDFLVTMFQQSPNIIKSKLNNPQYDSNQLARDSEMWHIKLASAKRQPAGEGDIVELQGMPHGWNWVNLNRWNCQKEGEAMGHCGNSGGKETDNIYSLRDERGVAHLTFIVNDGILGESKGYANNKPSEVYHPQIVALLLGKESVRYSSKEQPVMKDIINYIAGGGYKPENNFQFTDLSQKDQKKVLAAKPHILDFIKAMNYHYDNDVEKVTKRIQEMLEFTIESVEEKVIVVQTWGDFQEMIDWLKDETGSKLNNVPDFEDIASFENQGIDSKEAIEIFNNSANKENKSKVKQMGDFDELSDDDSFTDVLQQAADEGYMIGNQNDAYKHVTNYLNGLEDRDKLGFYLEDYDQGVWKLEIPIQNINRAKDVTSLKEVVFKYYPPDNYYGFDEDAYNERLSELLHELE